ncbi:methyltransferase domain-containing protein [Methanofollis aquaemaris]|uniref:Methyltransferase domain-containing protein n=1 Tax=Methanofollis aquaemaris TaxID=126734 RepID=A0A8A3S8Y2_9EURY|nr:methyltransferase domain-containing protein [Methanofollis aquaemaris]QSZ67996.1 methyltransferase domain-containing protein [Methanofollis aquaemaris]
MDEGLRGGPTQDEVAAVALWHLRLAPGCAFADVGCGTGKIAVAAARTAGRVLAIDRRSEAAACTRAAAETAGADNIETVCGEAAEVLAGAGPLDAAFVGGSRDLEQVLEVLAGEVRGRVVVDCVLLETLHRAVGTMQDLGIFREVISLQVARSHPLGQGMMMRPANPVWLVVGEVA